MLKLLYTAQDIILVKSIIIIFTNISTNNTLLSELAQPDIIECLFLLYSRDVHIFIFIASTRKLGATWVDAYRL